MVVSNARRIFRNSTGRHRNSGLHWRMVFSLLPAGLLSLAGCASEDPLHADLPRMTGTYNAPLVISGSPQRDQLALRAADDQLSEADWKILEKLGPKPIWQQINGARKRSDPSPPAVNKLDPPQAGGPVSAHPSPLNPAPPPPDETQLPVTNIEAPTGLTRFAWILRSHGGPSVATNRDASTNRRTVTTASPDLAPLVTALTQQLGEGGAVTSLPRENTLVVTCKKEMKSQALQLLATLDSPSRQVEITVRIFEVGQDFDFQQGAQLVLNRLISGDNQSLISTFSAKRFAEAVGSAAPVQGSALRLLQVFQDAGISVDFTFQLLAESGLIQVVSAPRMTVAVGQVGYMLAGQELPIQSTNIVNNVLQIATQYKPVGVQLYITPQSASDQRIKLHTISIVSSVSGFAPLPTLDGSATYRSFLNPIIDTREAETAVTIGNSDTLVISGLRMVRNTTRENKIPGLGDLPGLEWMFKNHRTQQQITDLYFFVTPTLLNTSSQHPPAPTSSRHPAADPPIIELRRARMAHQR